MHCCTIYCILTLFFSFFSLDRVVTCESWIRYANLDTIAVIVVLFKCSICIVFWFIDNDEIIIKSTPPINILILQIELVCICCMTITNNFFNSETLPFQSKSVNVSDFWTRFTSDNQSRRSLFVGWAMWCRLRYFTGLF